MEMDGIVSTWIHHGQYLQAQKAGVKLYRYATV
jgi:hypothetical protein